MDASEKSPRKLLLHACCGPCSLEPARILGEEGFDLTIYYANSNIAPRDEYIHREQTIEAWAKSEGIPFVAGPYQPDAWEATAGRIGQAALERAGGDVLAIDPDVREARCRACYRLRFEETAHYAAEHGFPCVGTTLSVSPYQYTDVIRQELERAAEEAGITPVFRDFRPNYDEAARRSRALGMYRQNFCGCGISAAERAQRKEQRRLQKLANDAAHAQERAAEEQARAARRAERAAYDEKQRRKNAVKKALRAQARTAAATAGAPSPDHNRERTS